MPEPAPARIEQESLESPAAEPAGRKCRLCREEIAPEATVCPHCQRSQRRFSIYHVELVSIVNAALSLALSLALLIVTVAQNRDAGKALREAEAGKKRTEEALATSKQALNEIARERAEMERSFAELFSGVCGAFKGHYESSSRTCDLGDGTVIQYTF